MLKNQRAAWSGQQDSNLRQPTDSTQCDSDARGQTPAAARAKGRRDSDTRALAPQKKFRVEFWADWRGRRLLYAFLIEAPRLEDATSDAWEHARTLNPRADELVRRVNTCEIGRSTPTPNGEPASCRKTNQ